MASNTVEIHDTNVYEDISLVLLKDLKHDFNLNIIKNNSLLFLKGISNSLIKKINVRGIQYCLVSDTSELSKIPFNFIIGSLENLSLDDNNTFILKDKNTLKCLKCSKEINTKEINTLDLCSCSFSNNKSVSLKLETVQDNIEPIINLNLIYTLKEPTYNKTDKFQTSMLRDAVRLNFASKRENYKKHMKQVSSIKSNTSQGSGSGLLMPDIPKNIKICKAITKKGIKCTNKCIKNSEYCGITSHKS